MLKIFKLKLQLVPLFELELSQVQLLKKIELELVPYSDTLRDSELGTSLWNWKNNSGTA